VGQLSGSIFAILVMLALKIHYSRADVDQLAWILAPLARLTALVTCARPAYEHGVGYVDFSQGIIIAPACAGINFMIMAFGLAALCGLSAIRQGPALFFWLALSLAGSYALTLVVNTLRIAMSMGLYQADIYSGWLTPERLHRLAGVALYLGALGAFFCRLQPLIRLYCKRFVKDMRLARVALPAWLPVGWYLVGAVGVPAANMMFQDNTPGFWEHSTMVMVGALVGWFLAMGTVRFLKRIVAGR
jgi:exosortase K